MEAEKENVGNRLYVIQVWGFLTRRSAVLPQSSNSLSMSTRERGGLVFKAHRLLYHSTLGLRVIKQRKKPVGVARSHRACHGTLGEEAVEAPESRARAVLVQRLNVHVPHALVPKAGCGEPEVGMGRMGVTWGREEGGPSMCITHPSRRRGGGSRRHANDLAEEVLRLPVAVQDAVLRPLRGRQRVKLEGDELAGKTSGGGARRGSS